MATVPGGVESIPNFDASFNADAQNQIGTFLSDINVNTIHTTTNSSGTVVFSGTDAHGETKTIIAAGTSSSTVNLDQATSGVDMSVRVPGGFAAGIQTGDTATLQGSSTSIFSDDTIQKILALSTSSQDVVSLSFLDGSGNASGKLLTVDSSAGSILSINTSETSGNNVVLIKGGADQVIVEGSGTFQVSAGSTMPITFIAGSGNQFVAAGSGARHNNQRRWQRFSVGRCRC